ncbi:MAG: DUF732 domain-containing protein [Mycobacterium sp.]
MITRSTTYSGAMVAAAVAVTAMLQSSTVAADPGQDDQFLAVLQSKQIPAIDNTSTVFAAGHTVCRKLDEGVPADAILEGLKNDAYAMDPNLRRQSARLAVTMSRFIAAAVEVYCPSDQVKIGPAVVSRVRQADRPTRVFTLVTNRTKSESAGNAAILAAPYRALGSPRSTLATGDIVQPKPPQVPTPKQPEAKIPKAPQAAAKPPPQQVEPPPPQAPPPPPEEIEPQPPQAPPPPEQIDPSADGPASGKSTDGTGSGNGDGSGSGGGGGSAGSDSGGSGSPAGPPQPAQPRPPGMIRLVPW